MYVMNGDAHIQFYSRDFDAILYFAQGPKFSDICASKFVIALPNDVQEKDQI